MHHLIIWPAQGGWHDGSVCGRPSGRLSCKINLNLLIRLLFPFLGIKIFEPPGGDRIFFSDFVPMRIIQFGHFQMIAIDGIKNKFIVGNLYDFVWFLVMIQSVIFWKIIKSGSKPPYNFCWYFLTTGPGIPKIIPFVPLDIIGPLLCSVFEAP